MHSKVKPGLAAMPNTEKRGIPPSNWAKFKGVHGEDMALFSYKSVHKCYQKDLQGSRLVIFIYDYRRNVSIHI